jgi:Ca-activated chloride channel family protein
VTELAQPLWLVLSPLSLAWAWLALRRGDRGERGAWLLRHPNLASVERAGDPPGPGLSAGLQALAFALLILALAQPREVGDWIRPPPEGRDIALVIDTSLTMSIDDFRMEGKKVARLAVLKRVIGRFIQARTADRFAVLAFGSRAATLTPPTFDHAHVLAQLNRLQVGMAGNDTALGDALGLALKSLRARKLRPAVILVSDGEPSNAGDMSPAEAVAVARQLGVAVHTIQIGSDLFGAGGQAQADPQPDLADIARLTGGQHWFVRSTADAETVIRAVDRLEKTLSPPARQRQVREWYWLPLALAAACLAVVRGLAIRRQGT